MDDARVWSLPMGKDLIDVFRYDQGQLIHVMGQDDAPADTSTPHHILALWQAAQAVADAALLTVRNAAGVALAMRNGGFIVTGGSSLNIGLQRAASKQFSPVPIAADPVWLLETEDRFQRVFWAIVARLDAAVLPRCFTFDIAGVRGEVAVENGALRFSGDFTSPEAFVAELRAASKIDEEIRYTLAAAQTDTTLPAFSTTDLLAQVATPSQDGCFTFDPAGWPLAYPAGETFASVRDMSTIAAGFAACGGADVTLSVLSDANLPLLKGTRADDGIVTLMAKGRGA